MIDRLPLYVSSVFILTTVLTIGILFWVIQNSIEKAVKEKAVKVLLGIIAWLALQAVLSYTGLYSTDINSLPPKILLFGVLPNIIMVAGLFFTARGKYFMDSLSIEKLTYLNLVRIPVEFVLWWLFLAKAIPQILTFEGWNFDIIMGLTAPLIIYFGFNRNKLSNKLILIWNLIGIFLLIFVFVIALLSSPTPLQCLAFDQPNVGLLYFPFSWLPTFIVPVVILGHLICVRRLIGHGEV